MLFYRGVVVRHHVVLEVVSCALRRRLVVALAVYTLGLLAREIMETELVMGVEKHDSVASS